MNGRQRESSYENNQTLKLPPTLVKRLSICVTMATWSHPNSLTTLVTLIMAGVSEGMIRRKLGKRRLSDSVISLAV